MYVVEVGTHDSVGMCMLILLTAACTLVQLIPSLGQHLHLLLLSVCAVHVWHTSSYSHVGSCSDNTVYSVHTVRICTMYIIHPQMDSIYMYMYM